eukprot:4911987-Pleurochrysis_carterae.AAC.1
MSQPTTARFPISHGCIAATTVTAMPQVMRATSDVCNMVARVGDKLIDDVFGTVVFFGKTQDRSLTGRKEDGDIVDRTAGHPKCAPASRSDDVDSKTKAAPTSVESAG